MAGYVQSEYIQETFESHARSAGKSDIKQDSFEGGRNTNARADLSNKVIANDDQFQIIHGTVLRTSWVV
jgi:hypothetical protein